jgi:hypothetical protein
MKNIKTASCDLQTLTSCTAAFGSPLKVLLLLGTQKGFAALAAAPE